MKRHPTRFGLLLALPLVVTLHTVSAQELEKIVIGHSSLRNEIAFLWVPKELGIFRKYRLDPSIVFIPGGVRMIQAIVAGFGCRGLCWRNLSIFSRCRRLRCGDDSGNNESTHL